MSSFRLELTVCCGQRETNLMTLPQKRDDYIASADCEKWMSETPKYLVRRKREVGSGKEEKETVELRAIILDGVIFWGD